MLYLLLIKKNKERKKGRKKERKKREKQPGGFYCPQSRHTLLAVPLQDFPGC
jgi:hypothetical protein